MIASGRHRFHFLRSSGRGVGVGNGNFKCLSGGSEVVGRGGEGREGREEVQLQVESGNSIPRLSIIVNRLVGCSSSAPSPVLSGSRPKSVRERERRDKGSAAHLDRTDFHRFGLLHAPGGADLQYGHG